MLSRIHSTFLSHKFQAKREPPSFERKYAKKYQIHGYEFEVEVFKIDSSLVALPAARLTVFPDKFDGCVVPHVLGGRTLCYVDIETVSWNPLSPESVIAQMDTWIIHTLTKIVAGDWEAEYQGEVSSYWGGIPAYLLSINREANLLFATSTEDSDTSEAVISDDENLLQAWACIRKQDYSDSNTIVCIQVLIKNMKVAHGKNWPPSNFKEVSEWLLFSDPTSYSAMMSKLQSCLKAGKLSVAVILNFQDDKLGFWVLFQSNVKRIVNGKPNGRARSKPVKHLSLQLTASRNVKSFNKLRIIDATPDFILRRNQTYPIDLRNKKIALIGCGNIGSYACQNLISVGAGYGSKGSLDIYDKEILTTENLGRNLLGIEYVGKSKSKSLNDYFKAQSFPPVTMNPYMAFTQGSLNNSHYDLIIDVTGNEPFSFYLSSIVREQTTCNPILIHGWNDAYGKAGRVIIDNRKICYGCLGDDRFKLFKSNTDVPTAPFNRRCGSTYTPYNSAISNMTAALVQEASLISFNDNKHNFFQANISNSIIKQDFKKLKPLKTCVLCSKK